MNTVLLVILAILPALVICYLIYRWDKYEKEGGIPLVVSFLLGVAVAFPALKIEEFLSNIGLGGSYSIGLTLVSSFIVVALTEEVLKNGALLAYPFPRSFFNEPMDGIVYAVMIAMGFATFENIIYATRYGFGTALLRAFTAVPAHAVFAILAGYFIGKAKINKEKRIPLILTGFGVAIGVHGLYDFFILQDHVEWLIIFAIVTLGVSLFFARKLILEHQQASPFRVKDAVVDKTIGEVVNFPDTNQTKKTSIPSSSTKKEGENKYDDLFNESTKDH